MTQPPGFATDTDALRWYGNRCAQISADVDAVAQHTFGAQSDIPDRAWGYGITHLLLLASSLQELRNAYEGARSAARVRTGKITHQLNVTQDNLFAVAGAYDAADERAAKGMPA